MDISFYKTKENKTLENFANEYLNRNLTVKKDGAEHRNVPNAYVAMAIIQIQEWETPYDDDTAFSAGTIFPCLNKPFLGGGK